MAKSRSIALCSSVSFYKQVAQAQDQLIELGFVTVVPKLVDHMRAANNYEYAAHQEKFNSNDPEQKKNLILSHFQKISQADAVLIVNEEKHGVLGYIGANVLMELAIALYFSKKIFILNVISPKTHGYDEVMAAQPIFLRGDVTKISNTWK
jgi:hypothetical protein